MPKILGKAKVKMNGELLESLPGAELDLGGDEREIKTGHRPYGYTEKVVPSMLTVTLVAKENTPIEDIRNFVDGVVVFQGDNGVVYQIENACTLKTVKIKDESGEVTVEMGGDPARRQ